MTYEIRPPDDTHAGCQKAYERERMRADFAEARLGAVLGELRYLAQDLDGLDGTVHEKLGHKTLGGAVRRIANTVTVL